MKLGLVTLHYKNLSDTIGLLSSLAKATVPKGSHLSIYVVDNEGSAKLKETLVKKFPKVRLLIPGSNLGFAAGNNLGFTAALDAGDEIIGTINNDTYVAKDFVKSILDSPINDKTVGLVGGLIYFAPGFEFHQKYSPSESGKVIWYAGGKFDWDNILGSNDHVDEVDHGQFQDPAETAFISGALLLARAEVFRKIGLFDENYFMYLEDVDLSHRARLAGFRLVFDPRIKLWHKVAAGSAIGSDLNDYFITRNRLYFGLKYAKPRTKFALVREALRFFLAGRPAQRLAVLDYFTGRLGKGSFIKS